MVTRAFRQKFIIEGEDRASDDFDKAGKSADSFSKKITKLAGVVAAAAATRAMVTLGKQAVSMAVDAEEAASAFETTFGTAVSGAQDFVDEFANSAGLAEFELQQMLATTGNVAQGIGATEAESAALAESMARLAGDVASFSNAAGGSEAVLMALQSSLTGEREALKTYGIAISEAEVQTRALADSGKQAADDLTRLEKASATVALAYEKAGKAVGDLDRTQDSSANTMRRLNALWKEAQVQIGKELLPALEDVLPKFEKLIPIIADVAAALARGLGAAVSFIVDKWDNFLVGLGQVRKGIADFINVLDVALGPTVNFGEAWSAADEKAHQFNITMRDVNRALEDGSEPMDVLRGGIVAMARELSATPDRMLELQDATGASNLEMERMVGWLSENWEALGLTRNQLRSVNRGLEQYRGTIAEHNAAVAEADRIEREFIASLGRNKAAADKATPSVNELAAAYFKQRDAIVAATQAQIEAASPLLGLLNAQDRVKEAQAALAETQANLTAKRKEDRTTTEDVERAQRDLLEAQLELEGSAARAVPVLEDGSAALFDVGENAGLSADFVQGLIDKFDDMPTLVPIEFRFTRSGDPEVGDVVFGRSSFSLGGETSRFVDSGSTEPFRISGNVMAFQEGGTIPGRGPKLILAHGGEEVLPTDVAAAFRAMLNGFQRDSGPVSQTVDNSSNLSLTFEGDVNSRDELEDALEETVTTATLMELLGANR